MANIAIIRLIYGMTITSAQLAGEILDAGHKPLIIFFKQQLFLPTTEKIDSEFMIADTTTNAYKVDKNGVTEFQMGIWRSVKPREINRLVQTLKDFKPDMIGFSCLSNAMSLAADISTELRSHFNVPIVWGGTGPTLEPERSIQHADLVCVGEGEDVIRDIGERLDQGAALSGIAGTWSMLADGTVQKNPKRPVSDLEKIAMPHWEAESYTFISGLKFEHPFTPNRYIDDRSYQIMTQRGCPFSCSFCVESWYQDEFGKKGSLRRMSPDKAIRELKFAKHHLGFETVTFMDDVFTVNPRWLKEFLPKYKAEIGLPFFCYTYPSTHNPEMLRMLVDAGCHAMAMGVQSGSERLLTEFFNRPTHYNRIIEAAHEIIDAGVPAATFDMIPQTVFDKEDDLRQTFELLLQLPKEMDTSFYAKMTYYPNYELSKKAQDPVLLASSDKLPEDTYFYYFKLFNLTRTAMPVEQIRAIANDPKYRENHELLNPFLNDDDILKPYYGSLIDLGIERVKAREQASNRTA